MAVVFYIFKAFTWCISRLPFPVLYGFSDFLCFILRDIARYRKKIVYRNLQNAFPEKSPDEIRTIARKYYRNLADVILETIKTEHITPEQLLERFSIVHPEVYESILKKDKSIILAMGHCGNWEWMGNAMGLIVPIRGYGVVKPLTNKRFDQYLTGIRNKMVDNSVIHFKDAFRTLVKLKSQRTMTAFVADQTPTRGEINYWTTFLNQETPFFLGIEKIARSLDMGVVFFDLQRSSRGHYVGDFQLITEEPKETKDFEITEKYVNLLQEAIRRNPDNWLWSHRRWKHKRT